MRGLVVWLVLSACVDSKVVVCSDGRVCPQDTECRSVADLGLSLCATHEQIDHCAGKAELDACDLTGVDRAVCRGGLCIDATCGNARMDPGEVCDDGNTVSNDMCSANCLSTEVCGNGVIDDIRGEICDDGNSRDHDGCTGICTSETLQWREHTLRPPPKHNAGAAYDPLRDRVVLFGGQEEFASPYSTQTFEWDGASWIEFAGVAPPGVTFGGMAFDGRRVITYGEAGRSDGRTWGFDGASWKVIDTTGPQKTFSGVTMAYDAHRGRVVMVGAPAGVTETWEWNGSTWAQVATGGPPPRFLGMMAYDPVRGVVVLAGGSGSNGSTTVLLADTWEYDGTTWRDVTPASGPIPQRSYGLMAFDAGSKRMIVFGGCNASPSCASPDTSTEATATLAWDGTTWTDLGISSANAPRARSAAVMVSRGSQLVLFGGFASFDDGGIIRNDTWIFEAGAWRQPAMPGLKDATIAFDPAHREIVAFGDAGQTGVTWTRTANGWSQSTGGPAGRTGNALVYDESARDVVLYGGQGMSDTWIWDGSAWSPRSPATHPTATYRTIGGFDGTHVIVVGGIPPTSASETWRWDGTNWTNAMPLHSPPWIVNGISGCGGYDPVHKRFVVLAEAGGVDVTWTYDGTDWTEHDVASPAPGPCASLAWNPSRERLVMTTGFEIWEWDGTSWQAVGTETSPERMHLNVVPSLDGSGVMTYGNVLDDTSQPAEDQLWELSYLGATRAEHCEAADLDGDMLARCADGDCWTTCRPLCPPDTSCPAGAPTCGDGTCTSVLETCHTCPQDCTCTPTCGDFACDPGETCLGDCP